MASQQYPMNKLLQMCKQFAEALRWKGDNSPEGLQNFEYTDKIQYNTQVNITCPLHSGAQLYIKS